MAPPKKKARANPNSQQPVSQSIVFRSPGLTPNTLLSALGQDYHVHSTILKLHSHYFRRFLDAPDKSRERASHQLLYHYVTVIDDDESIWSLESVEKVGQIIILEFSFV